MVQPSMPSRPLNILAIVGGESPHNAGLVSGLRRHYLLICRTVEQALDSAAAFVPDVVLVDVGLPETNRVNPGVCGRETAFVALNKRGSHAELPISCQYELVAPASADEFRNLITRITLRRDLLPTLTRTSA